MLKKANNDRYMKMGEINNPDKQKTENATKVLSELLT